MSDKGTADLVMTGVNRFHLRIDQIGVGLSLACALHCLAAPLLLAAVPLFGLRFVADELTEVVLLSAALALAVGSLCWGFRRHKSGQVFLLLGLAVLLVAWGRLFAQGSSESLLVVAGAVILASSHGLNWHLCRSCLDCQHPEHQGIALGMASPEIVLHTHDLALGYGPKTVFAGVNLTVRAGEFWCFLGKNGAGKTTLLRGLLGLLQAQAGRLQFHPELGGRERIGFVPQDCEVNPSLPMTAREFVLLGLVGIRSNRLQQDERLAWALDKMGLTDLADGDYWALSGGQRRRVLVARALVRRPTVLILDEPTANLDLAMEDTFVQTLAALHAEERNTILFVTHKMDIASRCATHIGLFTGGTLVAGPRDQVLTDQNLEQVFGQVSGLTAPGAALDRWLLDRAYTQMSRLTGTAARLLEQDDFSKRSQSSPGRSETGSGLPSTDGSPE